MKTLLEILSEKVHEAVISAGYGNENIVVTESSRPDLCQYQCNDAFKLAKKMKKNPATIAQTICEKLKAADSFANVEAYGGFINLTLSDEFLLSHLELMRSDSRFGMPYTSTDEVIFLDYGGPNIAKPLHIGHLRSAIIGEALKRIFRYAGYNVISDIHLGDWGLPMGLIMTEMETQGLTFRNGICTDMTNSLPVTVDDLNTIYPQASKRSKEDLAYLKDAQKITRLLQNKEDKYYQLWQAIRAISVTDLKRVYEQLNVEFDLWKGESDAAPYVTDLLDRLNSRGLLIRSNGAMVVDVSENNDVKPVPPIIVKKSDDSILYATTDLATIIQREQEYAPNQIWYIVDFRQALHFEQVFRCAYKAELVPKETKLLFLGFGTINAKDGKPFKTRDGGVMRLEKLLEMTTQAAYRYLTESVHTKIKDTEQKQVCARKIAVSAIKFGDLINQIEKNYIFDIDKFTSFEGKTGPYILYSLARINSIFQRFSNYDETATRNQHLQSSEERELVLCLINSAEAFRQAIRSKSPNVICEHVYLIANRFSKFYQTCSIVGETDLARKNLLLYLCACTKRVILLFLDLLGIDPIDNM